MRFRPRLPSPFARNVPGGPKLGTASPGAARAVFLTAAQTFKQRFAAGRFLGRRPSVTPKSSFLSPCGLRRTGASEGRAAEPALCALCLGAWRRTGRRLRGWRGIGAWGWRRKIRRSVRPGRLLRTVGLVGLGLRSLVHFASFSLVLALR